ncbi:DNA-binding response regulator [Mesoterricola silvestris]|uniref:DNA-binding response regulator n=2 Tax=Mesoterricola silvestris TaxID=2927979 RepID=A0AA48GVQ6_9BACT|nr:DNA-binding response regulator [Mesoterricola silvestris]
MLVVVVEDEGLGDEGLVRPLERAGCVVVNTFCGGAAAVEWLSRPREVDAVFLDANLADLGGLKVAKALGSRWPLVVTTSNPAHAADAFEWDAVDYLPKPVTAMRLERALRRIEKEGPKVPSWLPASPGRPRYPVQAGQGLLFVDLEKTTYFEVENEVVWAHAGRRLRTQWKTLGDVERAFPGWGLLRIHRHLLVRLEAVLGLKSTQGGRVLVRLAGGEELEASRGGAPRLREHFRLRGPGAARAVI